MKNKKILVLVLSSLIFGNYLQQGTQQDCSYVIVTEDGWRLHKNIEGKVLSSKSPSSHDDKIGKYSLDEYGNLIPFSECITEEEIINKIDEDVALNTNTDKINIEIDFGMSETLESFKDFFSNPSFSINGGLTIPYKLKDFYTLGYNYGLGISFNNLTISLLGLNVANEEDGGLSLIGNGFLIDYNFNWKNFYVTPGLGMIMIEGAQSKSNILISGNDTVINTNVGLYLGKTKKLSIYGSSMLSLTEIGVAGKALYFNMGIRYNF